MISYRREHGTERSVRDLSSDNHLKQDDDGQRRGFRLVLLRRL